MSPEELWAGIAQHLEAARLATRRRLSIPLTAEDYARMRERFLVGHRAHGGDILGWDRERFGEEARQEDDDALIYRAIERWRFG